MKVIFTRKGESILVDDGDYVRLNQHVWHVRRGYAARGMYHPNGGERRYVQPMHREVVGLDVHDPMVVDHINGNTLDNQRINLRICTRQQNLCNRGSTKGNTSGFKGVVWHKATRKWAARIKKNYKSYHLGLYETPEEAHLAYQRAAAMLHGEFANFGKHPDSYLYALKAQREVAVIAPITQAIIGGKS